MTESEEEHETSMLMADSLLGRVTMRYLDRMLDRERNEP